MTTVFDAAGKGSAKASGALMRRARADRFESASSTAKPSPFQRDASCKIKKPDMYWSAPRGAVRPVILAVEIGYVRRSEFKPYSITSLVMATTVGGILRSSALAVLRLMIDSKFVGSSTGRSAGFSPLRILLIYAPARRKSAILLGP